VTEPSTKPPRPTPGGGIHASEPAAPWVNERNRSLSKAARDFGDLCQEAAKTIRKFNEAWERRSDFRG
jgi:hypothetical protein